MGTCAHVVFLCVHGNKYMCTWIITCAPCAHMILEATHACTQARHKEAQVHKIKCAPNSHGAIIPHCSARTRQCRCAHAHSSEATCAHRRPPWNIMHACTRLTITHARIYKSTADRNWPLSATSKSLIPSGRVLRAHKFARYPYGPPQLPNFTTSVQ